MKNKRYMVAMTLVALALTNGCSGSDHKDTSSQVPDQPLIPPFVPDSSVEAPSMASSNACTLDGDCVTGAFCYNGQCVRQCSETVSCETGYYCQASRGRCVTQAYLQEAAKIDAQLQSGGDTMTDAQKQVLIEQLMIKASRETNAQTSIFSRADKAQKSVAFNYEIPQEVLYDPDVPTRHVAVATQTDLGKIPYFVNTNSDELPWLKLATPMQNSLGLYHYDFEIDTASLEKALARQRDTGEDKDDAVSVNLVSAAGNFTTTLYKLPPTNALYNGKVSPTNALSGIDLPIRMAIETEPSTPKTIDDIQSMTLYLPVAATELFNPENVKLQEDQPVETWARLTMEKAGLGECIDKQKACFVATFSTNDYVPYESQILKAEHRVNRNIRVEINHYSAADLTFSGNLQDRLTGLYRENDHWNETELVGKLTVGYQTELDLTKMSVHDHVPQTSQTRAPDDQTLFACTKKDVAALFESAFSEFDLDHCELALEDQRATCQTAMACRQNLLNDDGASTDNDVSCADTMIQVANTLLERPNNLSKILEKVLTSEPTSDAPLATVCGSDLYNFADFQNACSTAGCDLCSDHPEFSCAAELVAHVYTHEKSLSSDDQTALLHAWTALTRESYQADQYLAYDQDLEIRKSWLEGATYNGSFAARLMDGLNAELLAKHRDKVIDVQRSVLNKQLYPASLDMLALNLDTAQSLESASERNTILSDLAQSWETLATTLNLTARRHDVLSQNDAERQKAGNALRNDLSDLYFAGLIEANLCKRADIASASAAFGADLSSLLDNIETLAMPFEQKVFLRDGEVFKDTRLEIATDQTALETLQTAAQSSVEKAQKTRKAVFDEILQRQKNVVSAKDSYTSALKKIRAQIVELCGYPNDCTDKDNCKLFTASGFCGFALNSVDTHGVNLEAEIADDTQTTLNGINQFNSYDDCLSKTQNQTATDSIKTCLGATFNIGDRSVSTHDDVNASLAGQAILDYRTAHQAYQVANAEMQIAQSKVAYDFAMLETLKTRIESLKDQRLASLAKISQNVEAINKLGVELGINELNIAQTQIELEKVRCETEKASFQEWTTLAIPGVGNTTSTVGAYILSGMDQTSLSNNRGVLLEMFPAFIDSIAVLRQNAFTVRTTQAVKLERYIDVVGESAALYATLYKDSTNFTVASAPLLSAAKVEKYSYFASLAFLVGGIAASKGGDFLLDMWYKTDTADEIVKIQKQHLDAIQKLIKGNDQNLSQPLRDFYVETCQNFNDYLSESIRIEQEYQSEVQTFNELRQQQLQSALDLLRLNYDVTLKKIDELRALEVYETRVQQAQLLAGQYNTKLARYIDQNNLLFSAPAYFQSATDLEDVENAIEYARNDLDDYLTAIEYLTVRPFVELRRAIYTARGTNELDSIYEQLNDLTNHCGNGKSSSYTVNVSLRRRLGIPDSDLDQLSAVDRFHLVMEKAALPVDAQAVYANQKGLDLQKLTDHTYYLGSFDLTQHFANLSNSCNAKIDEIQVRLVSKPGLSVKTEDITPTISLIYGGHSQLLSCQANVDEIVSALNNRSTFGTVSSFTTTPFADGLNASIYDVPADTPYVFSTSAMFANTSSAYHGLRGYPLMGTYTVIFDTEAGENAKIQWDNVADIEIQFKYTTGSLGQDSDQCRYDL